MKYLIYAFIAFLALAGIAVAAPTAQNFNNIQPFTTDTYFNGTPLLRWLSFSTKYASTTALTVSGQGTGCAQFDSTGFLTSTGIACGSGGGSTFGTSSLSALYPVIYTQNSSLAQFSLAFGTTTSNTWAGTQTFTNAPVFSSLTGLLKGNGSSALTVGVNGTDYTLITAKVCSGGDFVSSVTAAGVFTCTTPSGTTYTATAPIRITGSVIDFTGLATTSQPSSSNLLTSNGSNGVYGTATSTFTPTSPLTGFFTQVGSGGTLGCQTASGSQAGCLSASDWTTFNNKQGSGFQISTTSPISISNLTYFTGVTPTSLGGVATNTLSGGTTGLTFSNNPGVIAAGASALSGTLVIANGGTATTTFRNNGVVFYSSVLGTLSQATSTNGFDFDRIAGMLTLSKQATVQTPISGSIAQFVGQDANPLRITLDTHNNLNTSGTALMFRNSGGTSASPSATLPGAILGSLNFRGYGATGYAAGSTGLMSAKNVGLFTDTSMPTAITFDTTATSSVTALERLRIDASGNVGVGSTSPWGMLSVNPISTNNSTPEFVIGSSSATHLIVTGAGNVGIGTTSPQWELNVASPTAPQIALSDGINSNHWTVRNAGGNLYFATSSPTTFATSSVAYFSITSPGSTHFGTVNCNNPLSNASVQGLEVCGVDNTTNGVQLGVSNNSPGTSAYSTFFLNNDIADNSVTHFGALFLNSSTYSDTTFGTGIAIGNQLGIQNTDGPLTLISSTSTTPGYINFLTGGTATANERMRIDALGRVGIGTTTPKWALTIASSTGPQLTLTDGSVNQTPFNFRSINGQLYISTSSPSTFATTSSYALRLDSTGTAGLAVGTTTPYKQISFVGTGAWSGLTTSAATQAGSICISSSNELINDSGVCIVSSLRYKDVTGSLSPASALSEVMQLNPIAFTYKPDFNGDKQSDPNYNGPQIGFGAEEVMNVDPRLVIVETGTTTFEGKTYAPGVPRTVRYEQMTALLAAAIQELNTKVSGATRSVEENYQWGIILLLLGWCIRLELKRK